ncbi:MAG: hypothetical protein NVS1B13_24720 [Flavisolibacter sp.]
MTQQEMLVQNSLNDCLITLQDIIMAAKYGSPYDAEKLQKDFLPVYERAKKVYDDAYYNGPKSAPTVSTAQSKSKAYDDDGIELEGFAHIPPLKNQPDYGE